MIDGCKIAFRSDTIIADLERQGIAIALKVQNETAEVKEKNAQYRSLRFRIFPTGLVLISGSLHKYWKGDNYSDFTYSDLVACIADLRDRFNIDPATARLENVEFGVNVSTLFDPFDFCDHVVAHKGMAFSNYRTDGGLEIGFEACRQQYHLKIYDKGRQYHLADRILRFEIAVKKMCLLKDLPVKYLADLERPEVLTGLGKFIDQTFQELIISDRVNHAKLSINQQKLYDLCRNPKSWPHFSDKVRYKRKIAFRRLIAQVGQNQWQGAAAILIRDKWAMLLSMRPERGEVLTGNRGDFNRAFALDNNVQSLDQRGDSNHLGNVLNPPPTSLPRFCKSCGRDISDQKEDSRFCSAKYVGERAAHQCRNRDSNQRNNFLSRERRMYGGLNLFNVTPFLSSDPIQA